MTTTSSVVTPERFAQGHDWDTYLSYIGSEENLGRPGPYGGARSDNSARFTRNIEQYALKPEQAAALRALPAHKVMVLGEDWCPDVYRGLPVVAAMCAAAGWELRIFQRDDHQDMMAEFPNVKDGQQFESIPVVVFYTADGFEEVARWIERPRLAEETISAIRQGVHAPGGRERGRDARPPAPALQEPADLGRMGRLAARVGRRDAGAAARRVATPTRSSVSEAAMGRPPVACGRVWAPDRTSQIRGSRATIRAMTSTHVLPRNRTAALDDRLGLIGDLARRGYTVEEIAEYVHRSRRAVLDDLQRVQSREVDLFRRERARERARTFALCAQTQASLWKTIEQRMQAGDDKAVPAAARALLETIRAGESLRDADEKDVEQGQLTVRDIFAELGTEYLDEPAALVEAEAEAGPAVSGADGDDEGWPDDRDDASPTEG